METKEKKAQEMYMQFQLMDQHIKQLQKQLEAVMQQLMELSATSKGLDDFSRLTGNEEVYVPLSSGIFAKAALKGTSELLVNIGANVVVAKDAASTKKLIQNQVDELRKVQKQMVDELEAMMGKAAQLEMQLQSVMPNA